MSSQTTIKVALDWTPNTIHTGLYVALQKGLYSSRNLDVQLLPPDASYTTTPAKRLENGEVDLAICPSESCIAYSESGKLRLQAIYAILQKDASAIVSTKLGRVGELGSADAGYGSYNAKYEDHIVKAMVTKDGGNGDAMRIQNSPGKLDLFSELKKGGIDATWVFMPWEGVEAEMEGVKLHVFKTEDYGVPYGYSPVIARNAGAGLSEEVLGKFVEATREGYEFAVQNAKEAAEMLKEHCRPARSIEFLEKSQVAINGYYAGKGALGYMQAEKWETWVRWLGEKELLQKPVEAKELYTNEFFTTS